MPKFFVQFADQRGFRGFARLDLAARKFPQPGQRFARRALGQKHAAVDVDQGDGRNQKRSSRPVIGVDVDVAVGQIAGPDRAFRAGPRPRSTAITSSSLLHVGGAVLFAVVRVAPAFFGHQNIAEPDASAGHGRPRRRICRWRPRCGPSSDLARQWRF